MAKTAEEMAEGVWNALPASAQVAIDLNYMRGMSANREGVGRKRWITALAAAFKTYALPSLRVTE